MRRQKRPSIVSAVIHNGKDQVAIKAVLTFKSKLHGSYRQDIEERNGEDNDHIGKV